MAIALPLHRVLVLACAVLSGAAHAQGATGTENERERFVRAEPRFERNPIYPVPVRLYGKLAVGYVKDPLTDAERVQQSKTPESRLRSLERSYFGLRGDEGLSGDCAAHFQLEHSFRPATGRAEFDEGDQAGNEDPFWDARKTVGLSKRSIGRVDLGRNDQPAWAIALQGEPWAGNTVGSVGGWLYRHGSFARTSGSLTYSSPERWPWVAQLQVAAKQANDRIRSAGASLQYDRGPWYVGIGWQRWADRERAIPLAIQHNFGAITVYGAHTQFRSAGNDGHATSLGARMAVMGKGDPNRTEWRFALATRSLEQEGTSSKLAAGWRYNLSRRTAVETNLALVNGPGGASTGRRTQFDIGLVHTFGRDLRWPQTP